MITAKWYILISSLPFKIKGFYGSFVSVVHIIMASERRVFGTKINSFQKPNVNPKTGLYEVKEYNPKIERNPKITSYKPEKIRNYKIHEYKPIQGVTYRGTTEYKPKQLNHYYEYNPDYKHAPRQATPRKKPTTPVASQKSPEPRPASSGMLWPANLKALGTIKRQLNIFMDMSKSRVQPSELKVKPKSRERARSSRGSRPISGKTEHF